MDATAFSFSLDEFNKIAVKTVIAGVIAFISGIISSTAVEASGMSQAGRWRNAYLRAILRQDIGWFDVNNPNELSSKIAANCQDLEAGINAKWVEIPRNFLGMGLVGIGVAFSYSWDMSLVMMASTPIAVFGMWFLQKATTDEAAARIKAYAKAGGLASECISELRTVAALGAEKAQAELYKDNLLEAEQVAVTKSWKMGLANGMMFANADGMAATGLIYGAYVILKDQQDSQITINGETYTCSVIDTGIDNPAGKCPQSGGDLMIAMFALQMGFMGLGMIEPAVGAFTKARVAA